MRISDWSSDVCASDLQGAVRCGQSPSHEEGDRRRHRYRISPHRPEGDSAVRRRDHGAWLPSRLFGGYLVWQGRPGHSAREGGNGQRNQNLGEGLRAAVSGRSEEHTSELQSLMRNSYAVFCLKKKKKITN